MTWFATGSRETTSPRREGDAGLTLVELIVAMSVFGLFMSIVMATIVGLSRTALHAQNSATTAADVRKVFQTMDKQVRYADAINFPGQDAGSLAYWVEFRTTPAASTSSTCVQWRFVKATGQLQTRSWPASGTPSASWSTVFTTSATVTSNPFTMVAIASPRTMQQLQVSLVDSRPAGGATPLSVTFVARNSTPASLGNADLNSDGVSDNPVCAPSGYRS